MRFLVDQCLSAQVAHVLRAAGHEAEQHVGAYGLSRADDAQVLARAAAEDRVLVSADTNFGGLLAERGAALPSVVLFRRRSRRRPHEQATILLTNLPGIEDDLRAGAVAVIGENGIRVRRLPIGGR